MRDCELPGGRPSTRKTTDAASRERDPGYYLISSGRRALEKAIGFRMPIANWVARAITEAGIVGYVAAIGVVAGVVLAVPLARSIGIGCRWMDPHRPRGPGRGSDIGSGRRRD